MQVWGGRYVPIVPSDGESIEEPFWRVLKAYDPDYLFRYQPVGADIEEYDSEVFSERIREISGDFSEEDSDISSQMEEREIEDFRNLRLDETQVDASLRSQLLEGLNPFHFDEETVCRPLTGRRDNVGHNMLTDITDIASISDLQEVQYHDFSALPAELHLLATSVMGEPSNSMLGKIHKRGVAPEVQKITPSQIDNIMDKAWDRSKELPRIVYDLTNLNCVSTYPVDANRFEEPGVIICGDSIEDYCLYQCLQSLKLHVFWLPKSLITPDSTLQDGDTQEAAHRTRYVLCRHAISAGMQVHRGDHTLLVSDSMDSDQLKSVKKTLLETPAILPPGSSDPDEVIQIADGVSHLLSYRRRVFERDNRGHSSVLQFDRGASVGGVETPKPKHFEAASIYDHQWITDLEVENYNLPQEAEFGPQTIDINLYDSEYVRTARKGFSYVCPHHTYFGKPSVPSPTIRLEDPLRLFQTLFGKASYYVQPSDKGDFQTQVIQRVGDLEDLSSLLLRPEIRALLRCYSSSENSTSDGNTVYLKGSSRAYLAFRGIAERIEGSDRDVTAVIDELTDSGFLRRGLILQCQFCRNADWYDLEKVSQSFRCERCRQTQQIKQPHWKKPKEGPRWYFELDEIVYQYHDNNTHVTTLALSLLKSESESFLYAPELEIRNDPDKNKPDFEIDICAIADGKLTLGEASSSADKGEDDVDDYVQLAKEVNAKTVVFATMASEWSGHIKNYAEEKCEGSELETLFLEEEDLLQVNP